MKHQRYVLGLLLGFIINTILTSVAFAGIGLTYHGRILKPDGSVLEASTVQFTIQIRSPGNESCLLYQESQTVDMTGSGGVFSLELGANPGYRVAAGIDGGNSISKIFANQGTLTLPSCTFGTTYTPNSADGRLLYISFNDGSGAQTLSAQKITYVPYAIESMQVNGYGATQLVRVDSGTAPVLTAANLTTLNELFNGTLSMNTSGNVTSTGTVSAADLQSTNLKIFNGTKYVQFSAPVLASNVLFKLPAADGSSNQVLKTDGAGNLSWATVGAGSVTSVSVTAPLTSSGTATAPIIALPAATTSQSGYLSNTDWNTFNSKLSAVTLADIRSTITPFGGAFANANCTAAQSLYYESSSDSFKCQSISLSSNSGAVGGSTITASTSIVSPIIYGSTAASGTLTLDSTSDATKGNILMAPTGGSVGIGTASPTDMLTLSQTDGAKGLSILNLSSTASRQPGITIKNYSGNFSGGPTLLFESARGSYGSATAIQSSDSLGQVLFQGLKNGSNYAAGAMIYASASENWTSSTAGTNLIFNTISTGATSNSERMRIDGAGNVGIGASSINNLLQVGPNGSQSSRYGVYVGSHLSTGGYGQYVGNWNNSGYWGLGPATNSGSDNTIQLGNTSDQKGTWSGTQNMKLVVGGGIGIGITNPIAMLDVRGSRSWDSTIVTMNYANDGFSALTSYSKDGIAKGIMGYGNPGAATVPDSVFMASLDNTPFVMGSNSAERMRILGTGEVGIGTTTPGSTLDVKGTLRLSGSTSGYTGFKPAAAAGSTVWTLPTADGSSGQVLSTNGSGVLSWATGGSGDFKADGSVSMTGTLKAPNGAWNAPSLTFASSPSTGFYNGGGMIGISANGSLVGTISSGTVAFNGSYGPYMKVGAAANNLPATPTYSFSGDTDTGLFLANTNTIALATAGNEVLRVDATGKVGIGTTAPEATLNVNNLIQVGMQSGLYSTLGANSVAFQRTAAAGTYSYIDQIGIGGAIVMRTSNAAAQDTNAMTIASSGNVGIGTLSPSNRLSVLNSAAPNGTNTNLVNFFGGADATLGPLGMFFWANPSATAGDRYMGIGVGDSTGARSLILGMNSNGATASVGINTTTPGYPLDVNGATANVSGAWVVRSDARLKRDIASLEKPLETVLALHGVSFRWKDSEKDKQFGLQRGFIAQEVEEVIPDWVHEGKDGFKRIEKTGIEAYFVEAIKELYNKWFEDHGRIAELEKQNRELKEALCEINPKSKICI